MYRIICDLLDVEGELRIHCSGLRGWSSGMLCRVGGGLRGLGFRVGVELGG